MASLLESHRCFALRTKHEGKYLQSVYRKTAGGSRIEASADAVAGNARTRFFVEPSEEEDGLVHVRSCYNYKYWVAVKDTGSSRWVIGTANEAVEDLTRPSCTLFAPIASTDHGDSIRFRHHRLQKYARVSSIDDVAKPYLQLADDEQNAEDIFTVLGLSEEKELPRYIALKQSDGNYFGVRSRWELFQGLSTGTKLGLARRYARIEDYPVLVFHTQDIGDATVIWTVLTNDDGTVRMKSNKEGMFWKRNKDDNIVPHKGETSDSDADTLFKVIHGDGFIAFRNLGNDKICQLRRDEFHYEYLKACETSLSQYTQLQFDEPIHRREIYDVKFHLDEARIYNNIIVKSKGFLFSNEDGTELEATFSFVQKTAKETKWQNSVSETSGLQSSISIATGGECPVIVNGEVTLSKETTSSHGKEGSESHADETTLTEKKMVPAGQKMAGQLVAMRSSCDVPYSYKQKYLLSTGHEVPPTTHDDGIYTVENNYGFRITVSGKAYDIKRIMGEGSSGGL